MIHLTICSLSAGLQSGPFYCFRNTLQVCTFCTPNLLTTLASSQLGMIIHQKPTKALHLVGTKTENHPQFGPPSVHKLQRKQQQNKALFRNHTRWCYKPKC